MSKFIIPHAALQQHIAVLGKTGSGKTFAAKAVIVEPLLAAGKRVGIIDPTDAWWGLRSSRDGKGAGFHVLVLGGDHGDLPLPAAGGAAVARLLVEQGVNLVASTKHLTVGERTRWFIDFAGTLSRINRAPLHLVIDEAHNFAPQGKVPDPDTGRMLHAANALASGGRSIGVRLTMITQRPQKLHKDTLTSADTLIAMRVLAPHDRLAVEDWIKGCGDLSIGKEVLNSLAGLKRGEGWVWYPEGGHLSRTRFPEIRTFDSSATPIDGHAVKAPKAAAEIDLTEINKALAEAVREAEANDPRLLRAEIARLKRETERLNDIALKRVGEAVIDEKRDAEIVAQAEMRGRMAGRDDVLNAIHPAHQLVVNTVGALEQVQKHLSVALPQLVTLDSVPLARARIVSQSSVKRPTPVRQRNGESGDGSLGNSGKRRMLIALAQNSGTLTYTKLSLLTGISQSGGTWRTYLGELRSLGLAEGGNPVRITSAGLKALGNYEALPTGQALIDYWRGRLGQSGKRAIFDAVVAAYPRAIAQDEISAQTGIAMAGGTWRTYLGELRGLELIEGRGELRASEELF